jgi:hypothetical protein
MDCKTARLLLDLARPHSAELHPSEAGALKSHLAGCPECDSLARVERQLDDHVGRALRAVPVPDGLRDRLLKRLAGRRRAWYASWAGPAAGVAAAAALLFIVWFYWPHTGRPQPDLERIGYEAAVKIQTRDPEQVAAWFQARYNLVLAIPRELRQGPINYNLLADYDLADCQGQRTPRLLLTYGSEQARIYILTSKQFDLKDVLSQQRFDSNGVVAEVHSNPDDPDTAYVVVYTGKSLTPFLVADLGEGAH